MDVFSSFVKHFLLNYFQEKTLRGRRVRRSIVAFMFAVPVVSLVQFISMDDTTTPQIADESVELTEEPETVDSDSVSEENSLGSAEDLVIEDLPPPLTYEDVYAQWLTLWGELGRLADRLTLRTNSEQEAQFTALPAERMAVRAQAALASGNLSGAVELIAQTQATLESAQALLDQPLDDPSFISIPVQQVLDTSSGEQVAAAFTEKQNALNFFDQFERELMSPLVSLSWEEQEQIALERALVRQLVSRSQARLNARHFELAGEEAREALQALTRAKNILLLHAPTVPLVLNPLPITEQVIEFDSGLMAADRFTQSSFSQVESWFDGSDWELIVKDKDGEAVAQLTDNDKDDLLAETSYRLSVWQTLTDQGWELMITTAAGTRQLTLDAFDDTEPQTDGRFVVWLKTKENGAHVWMYDVITGFLEEVSDEDMVVKEPMVANGVITWQEWSDEAWIQQRFLSSELMEQE